MREMLDKYWPWGSNGPKPRGLRNLRLEGLFPNKELEKAKRCVSPLGLGRPGGGAPVVTHSGKRLIRTREDPIIRFQWNKDLRKCVDNTLRYKTDREERELYRRQLDAQIAERKLREKQEKRDNLEFHKRSGWSTEKTLKTMTMDSENYGDSILKDYEDFKRLSLQPATKTKKYDYSGTPRNKHEVPFKAENNYGSPSLQPTDERRRLSPLNRNFNGEELVPLLAKQRAVPLKIPLGTTDVTRGNPEKRNPGDPGYLRDLTNQVESKRQRLKEIRADDIQMVQKHFKALDEFWGRPGHGAPRSVTKKGCLDRLLFDHTICVH